MIITIDGPSASGKSTVARRLALELRGYYLCSGLLFRGLAYVLCTHYGYDMCTIAIAKKEDVQAVLARLSYTYSDEDGACVFFNNENISLPLKNPLIDQTASLIGTNVFVRKQLEIMQHTIVQKALEGPTIKAVIVDGRDSGSVVFPNAEYKWYLTASPEVRAQRMSRTSQQETLHELLVRDERDTQRAIAPLIIPLGALVIDTSNRSIEQVVQIVKECLK